MGAARKKVATVNYRTIGEIIAANWKADYMWFHPKMLKRFGTEVFPEVYGGRYFITSEPLTKGGAIVAYTVREILPDGSIQTAGDDLVSEDNDLGAYRTHAGATRGAMALARRLQSPTKK